MFVRVEDLRTGHQYDVDESRVEYLTGEGHVKALNDPRWPDTDRARAALPRTDKAGRGKPRPSTTTSETPDTTAGDQT